MSMSDEKLEQIVTNEKEWRKYLFKKVEKIEEAQDQMNITITTLKIKYGFMASFFGVVGGFLATLLIHYKK